MNRVAPLALVVSAPATKSQLPFNGSYPVHLPMEQALPCRRYEQDSHLWGKQIFCATSLCTKYLGAKAVLRLRG